MINEEFVPIASYMGISPLVFFELTPKRFTRILPFFNHKVERMKEEHDLEMAKRDLSAWATGLYVANAIGSTFGKAKYPKKPLNVFSTDALEPSPESLVSEKAAEFAVYVKNFNAKRDDETRKARAKEIFEKLLAENAQASIIDGGFTLEDGNNELIPVNNESGQKE